MNFVYGEREIAYLKSRDRLLGAAIDRIGSIERAVEPDVFTAVVQQIVGQQISMAAYATVWKRMMALLGRVTPENVCSTSLELLQKTGVTYRKAAYIRDFALKVQSGAFDIEALRTLDDEQVIARLCTLRGVGAWTAEMLLIFCLQRPDVLSYGDLAILRGMRMLYRHRKIDAERFARYRRRYSPCATVASLYLWAVACGELEGLTDLGRSAAKKSGRA